MSIPLWTLLAFAAWTLVILLACIGVSRWSKVLTGRAQLTDFPADRPHGSTAYRRFMRAHMNCVENLPVYGAIVVGLEFAQLSYPLIDRLAIVFIGARVLQSLTHVAFPETNITVFIRFSFFFVQIICMIALIVLLVAARL